jgi:hypothetical protein
LHHPLRRASSCLVVKNPGDFAARSLESRVATRTLAEFRFSDADLRIVLDTISLLIIVSL